MSTCTIQHGGTIELYFYGELDAAERARIARHLRDCRECASALAELNVIRDVLAGRPAVSAPHAGDWTAFMARLDASIAPPSTTVIPLTPKGVAVAVSRRPLAGWVAMAALLALVALSVLVASRAGRTIVAPDADPAPVLASAVTTGEIELPVTEGLRAVGLRHLERSKLVVLGLAARDAEPGPSGDWAYERELATALLADTRLYRQAAESRGLESLAGVMKDLELVLLQTSMAEASDATALPQIQRLIRRRGLVEKMDVVGTTGLVP